MCVFERFVDKFQINRATGCWEWIGGRSTGGRKGAEEKVVYGTFRDPDEGPMRAHVWIAWQFGIIDAPRLPIGFQLDHTCVNSLCVNPWHLELVPKQVNYDRRFHRSRLLNGGSALHHL